MISQRLNLYQGGEEEPWDQGSAPGREAHVQRTRGGWELVHSGRLRKGPKRWKAEGAVWGSQ
jgi:hypothetical protein